MYKRKNNFKIFILTLIFSLTFLGIGFAAFSNTLTISSSATVTPDASSFSVQFSKESSSVVSGLMTASDSTKGSTATLSGTTISGITANFTKPGDTVTYQFYIINDGKYKANLNSVLFGTKTCTAIEGTTETLAQAACEAITLKILYGVGASTSSGAKYQEITGTTSGISNQAINIGAYALVILQIEYATNGTPADGDFIVNFGDIEFNYSTV